MSVSFSPSFNCWQGGFCQRMPSDFRPASNCPSGQYLPHKIRFPLSLAQRRQSAVGQSLPKCDVRPRSALLSNSNISQCRRHVSKVPGTELAGLPRIPHHAIAGRACGDVGELALEGGGGGPAVDPFHLGGGGGQRRVMHLCCTIDDEGDSRQRGTSGLCWGQVLKSCAHARRLRSVRMSSVSA